MIRLMPHVTEKTLPMSQKQVYTFVTSGAHSADEIRRQLSSRFGLHPRSIRIARRARKARSRQGRLVSKRPLSTVAYVTLPKPETVKAFTPKKEKS